MNRAQKMLAGLLGVVVAQDAAVALTWAYQTYGFRTAVLDYLSTEEVAIAASDDDGLWVTDLGDLIDKATDGKAEVKVK